MTTKDSPRERGAVFVEFVLVVPFFLMLLFMIVSFGAMLSFRQTMSQAAAEGARAAAVAPSDLTYSARRDRALLAVNEAFQGESGSPVVCGGTLTCTVPAVPATCGDANKCITVTVQYAYRANPRIAVPQFFGYALPETLSYTASARVE